jgi:hypothetical protein
MPAPSPETVARARHGYVAGVPVSAILIDCGLALNELYRCLDGDFDDGSGTAPQPVPRRRVVVRRVRSTRAGNRAALTQRLWRTAERQVREIEERLTIAHQEPTERERDARVLSVLVKTLRELSAFEAEPGDDAATNAGNADDDFPRDVDELRRELSRRLDSMAEGAAAGIPVAPERNAG